MSTEAIDSLLKGDVTSFRSHIEDALMSKIADRLELERVEAASQFFDNNSYDTDE